jgi:hypothetical protein
MANAISLISLVLITIAYFVLRTKMNISKLSETAQTSLPFIYLFIMILVQIFTNSVALSNLCGSVDTGRVIIATVIPWVFVFGVLIILLKSFPGWKAPFSNTIGYLFISGSAAKIIPEIFKGKMTGNNSGAAAQALEFIYDDQSMLINEITPTNFDSFWAKMEGSDLIQKKAQLSEYKQKLRKLVQLKDTIATAIWYLMTGFLVTSFSYHNMVSAKCERSKQEMEQGLQAHKERLKKNAEKVGKIYTSRH